MFAYLSANHVSSVWLSVAAKLRQPISQPPCPDLADVLVSTPVEDSAKWRRKRLPPGLVVCPWRETGSRRRGARVFRRERAAEPCRAQAARARPPPLTEDCVRICGDSGTTVTNASRSSAAGDSQRTKPPSPLARRRRTGAWPDMWWSSRPYATTISTRSASPDSTPLLRPNSVEPPWYGPVCPVVWEGRHREMPPYPDQSQLRPPLRNSPPAHLAAMILKS